MMDESEGQVDSAKTLESVLRKLRQRKITVDLTGDVEACCSQQGRVKMVCIVPDLGDSVRELGKTARDQVVMVRVDEGTSETLDAWVATGAVKSRSEAAALFIREGLKVRADELARLREALRELEEAKDRLRQRAKEVFGAEPESDAPTGG